MIDLHTHLHPPRLFAAIRRWFAERSDWDIARQPTEPGDVAAALRAAGVERFVFCSYAHKAGMARELNAWLAATARALGGYGLPLATVHPDDPDPLADLRAALDDGCIGLKVHEDVQRVAVDDARLAPILAEVARRGGFVLVHAGPIPWTYAPLAAHARVARVLAEHPALNVVVAHLGIPDTRAYVASMERHPRLHLDTTMAFAAGSPFADRRDVTAETLTRHAARIVYGTDFPNVPYPYAEERAGLAAYGLAPEVLRAIEHDNAARLLRDAGVAV